VFTDLLACRAAAGARGFDALLLVSMVNLVSPVAAL
jgi:hypothetical protein